MESEIANIPVIRSVTASAWLCLCAATVLAQDGTSDNAVRDAAMSVRYEPANPSRLSNEWEPWIKEAGATIEIVGAGAEFKALATDIAYEALRAGLDPTLVLAVVEVLSKFDENAISANGIGLMSLPISVQTRFGRKQNTLFMGKYNLRLGCNLLAIELGRGRGDILVGLSTFLVETSNVNSLDAIVRVYQARSKSLDRLNPIFEVTKTRGPLAK